MAGVTNLCFHARSGPQFLMILSWVGSGSPPLFLMVGTTHSSPARTDRFLCLFQSDPPEDHQTAATAAALRRDIDKPQHIV